MVIDFTDEECEVLRRALTSYVGDLREEITKTEQHEWLEGLRRERDILGRVIERLSVG